MQRAVTRVHTAGTVIEDASLDPKIHTYLGALYWNEENNQGGLAWADVSTGYWAGLHVKKGRTLAVGTKIAPRELLLPEGTELPASIRVATEIQTVSVPLRTHFEFKQSAERVLAAQG